MPVASAFSALESNRRIKVSVEISPVKHLRGVCHRHGGDVPQPQARELSAEQNLKLQSAELTLLLFLYVMKLGCLFMWLNAIKTHMLKTK